MFLLTVSAAEGESEIISLKGSLKRSLLTEWDGLAELRVDGGYGGEGFGEWARQSGSLNGMM